ncbi:hypothetical protein EI545_14915 [Tabrizicola piscis]|uniref:Uncharacterized protein n=1 Tax=Tabrizicola piscis TaxID=2494374 RepID=A0A3S8U8X4_9RHOB|nr:hypothetical protein [Tabrizicola piscis]AZL60008.1 hypothetical protein EI545_14915 [Tabrizicola piscis]
MKLSERLKAGLFRQMLKSQHRAALAAVSEMRPPQDPTIVIARVIGNDLWPRHTLGQSLQNLEFVLTREPAFRGTRKLFVLTRIMDAEVLARAESMVREAGHDVLTLPFDPVGYAALRLDTSAFGGDDYFMTKDYANQSEHWKWAAQFWVAASKIRHVMDVNGGRNAALEWGQARADWTLVLDGSCFLSAEGFQALHADLTSQPYVPYISLPMQRLSRNENALTTRPDPNSNEEPQLAFSSLAKGRFDMAYPYGLRDKTSLLRQIGVPGAWDRSSDLPWLPALPPLPDSHCWKRANSAVFRLSSGIDGGELELPSAGHKRYHSRNQAIFLTLAALDARLDTADRERAHAILGLGYSDA